MEIPKDKLLAALTSGVNDTLFLMTRISEFEGSLVKTEYMLTADLARALARDMQVHDVKVEYLNRRFLDAMTMLAGSNPHKALRSKRTDVAVINVNAPLAIIEVKIRVGSLRAIRSDLDKITTTLSLMRPEYAGRAWGVVVFQVHVPGAKHRYYDSQFREEVDKIEKRLRSELDDYERRRSGFDLDMRQLAEDIVGRDIEDHGEGPSWGVDGHGTRFLAIIIRDKRSIPNPPRTLAELRATFQ
jgi:hypothetical protein